MHVILKKLIIKDPLNKNNKNLITSNPTIRSVLRATLSAESGAYLYLRRSHRHQPIPILGYQQSFHPLRGQKNGFNKNICIRQLSPNWQKNSALANVTSLMQ